MNSANLGPYGDAIMYELLPYIEKRSAASARAGRASLTEAPPAAGRPSRCRCSYPDEFNGTFAACPDPIDFRAYTVVDIYKDTNAYYMEGPHYRVPRPANRNYLGHISATVEGDELISNSPWEPRAAPASNGISGKRSTRPSAKTAIRSASSTS